MTLLIDTSAFSERVDVSDHVADKYLDRHILTAQDRYLKPLLGAAFYTELLEEKETGYWQGINEAFVTNYVTPYLVWRSYQTYLPHSNIFFTGMGPRILEEDNSRPIGEKRLNVLTDEARNQAQFYEREMYEYLCDNKASFESWEDATDKNRNTYLPNVTAAGKPSRRDKIKDGWITYNKERD